jgi:hypothetical protein
MRMLALTALVAGCGGSPTHPARPDACPSDHPLGSIADYAPPALPGFVIAKPQLCARDEAYIKIERAAGARRLGIARSSSGGFSEGCMTLPADPADPTECPVISASAILTAAHHELDRRKLGANGTGLGPCGDANGDYAAWNMAAGVIDWKNAEMAVRIVAELLDRYDVSGYVGVAVVGIVCGVAT